MTREEKSIAIEDLTAQLADVNVVYLADISGLDADTTSNLRRACFKAGIKLEVVKNTLLEKAMDMFDSLLKIQGYRNSHLRIFLKELSA